MSRTRTSPHSYIIYKYPDSGRAAVRQAAAADVVRQLVLPRLDDDRLASFSVMSRSGYAKIDLKFRAVSGTQIPKYKRSLGRNFKYNCTEPSHILAGGEV